MAKFAKFKFILLMILTYFLFACSGGGGNGSGGSGGGGGVVIRGNLAFTDNSISVTKNSTAITTLTLRGSVGVKALAVNLSSSNFNIATVTPSICYLSSATQGSTCRVVVHGLAAGSVTITASAVGYTSATITANVGTTPIFGSLVVNGHTSNFSINGQAGQTITLLANLSDNSSGLDGIPINISGSGLTITPPQINVDSSLDLNHYALFTVTLPNTIGSFPVTAQVVGTFASNYTPITITLNTQAAPAVGTIALDPYNVAVPLGMSSPAWLTLLNSSGVGNITVNLTSSNPGVATVTPSTCVISSAVPVCGLSIKSVALGNATISATNSAGYSIGSILATVVAQSTTGRTITFTNNNTNKVWVGITSGTSNSYISSLGIPSASQATTCGPSNSMGACPTGSICGQGGANPSESTTWFCYWQQPAPEDGNYQLQNGNHPSTSIFISNSSYDPIKDIIWSGNFYPRQLCDANGVCQIASCGNSTSGFACALGTGGSPAVATLAETTLQLVNTDYYDISLINGSNVPVTFAPSSNQQAQNSYFCGTPGSFTAQSGLNAAAWNLATTVQTTTNPALYNYVSGTGSTPACTTDANCVSFPGTSCGYNTSAVNNGSSSTYQLTCGTHLAWLTADEIWAMNTNTTTNLAPFPFSGSYNTNTGGATIQNYQLFECTKPLISGYAAATTPATPSGLACGCTNWTGVASPSGPCVLQNTIWGTNVLPTITWLKQSCPTCYTYPFDDLSSTFQCKSASTTSNNAVTYQVTFY